MLINNTTELAPKGSVGTGLFKASGFEHADKILVEFQVEAIGATPTLTFTIQGSVDGVNFSDVEYLDLDSATAVSKAGIVVTTASLTRKYLDGLAQRFVSHVGVNVSANTNVTFSARAYKVDHPR